jgi:DNA-binding GntR family transcriptional regulator
MPSDPSRDQLQAKNGLLPERIKRHVLESIVNGQLAPGERIYEIRLARDLGTSQAPVREALRELAAIGLVEISPRRGASVRTLDSTELVDTTVLRAEIDALAARLAASTITPEGLEQLRALQDQMRSSVKNRDLTAFSEDNSRFHGQIAAASLNSPLLRVYNQLEPFAKSYVSASLPRPDLDVMLAQHDAIIDGLASRDAEAAAQAAREHQLHVAQLVIEQILEEDAARTRHALQTRLGTAASPDKT